MSVSFNRQLFRDYFKELWGNPAFPWQGRLAQQVIEEGWPPVIDLPTASGKTACIDIAVFALACGRGSRRIFFVVDRKVIVDEAFSRAKELAKKLKLARQGALFEIANRLRELGGETKPLHACELRGGIFRDVSWVKSPLQPTIIASTVDQVGSRLLFRGYGVSGSSQPIHAALIANDSLLLLDEAHCSKPFAQTLEQVQHYRSAPWGNDPSNAPFGFVEMTATPSRAHVEALFQLDVADRENDVLKQRLVARKMTRFVVSKAKADDSKKLAAELIREAKSMAEKPGIKRVAVMVNRVETARAVAQGLAESVLVIGRMRPVDRTELEQKLGSVHSGVKRSSDDPLSFVVSTQCLEVGADLDFDALVTELPSMNALLQRFGRLNRLGALLDGAFGCIVASALDPKKPDPIYGDALRTTREWLEPLFAAQAERDLGIEGSDDTIPRLWRALPQEQRGKMTPPPPDCARLWPAHLDALVQTSPRPIPEPAVGYFLHGKQNDTGEISVVWRSEPDLKLSIALCPPVVNEALPVKIWALRAWMTGTVSGPQMDVEGGDTAEEIPQRRREKATPEVLVWRGGDGFWTRDGFDLRPGDSVVLPATSWTLPELGYVPPGSIADVGDQAFFQGREAIRLRLHPSVMPTYWDHFKNASNADDPWAEIQKGASITSKQADLPQWLNRCLSEIVNGRRAQFTITPYADGYVVESKKTLRQMADDAGGDDRSRGEPISLTAHTASVVTEAWRLAVAVLPPKTAAAVATAARWHDSGKVDERFQAILFGGDAIAAQLSPVLRAKGGFTPQHLRKEHRVANDLPEGFRHELTSLLLAEKGSLDEEHRDLVLHLIASHHGYCRPFAPVVLDDAAENLIYDGVSLASAERRDCAAHALHRGVAERFWRLTRRHGWWGLAYMEALLRLADWKVSSEEQRKATKDE